MSNEPTSLNYALKTNTITPSEYLFLRKEAGWGDPDLTDIAQAIEKSVVFFSLYDGDNIVGCIRLVGDGKLCFYIQDLMVAQTYRGQGCAKRLFEAALAYIEEHAAYNAFVGLMAAKGVDSLYERYQFDARPNPMLGPGMTRFWGREGEFSEE